MILSMPLQKKKSAELRSTQLTWIEHGLGTVKRQVTELGSTDTFELVDTNRTPAPEPSARLLGAAALVAISLLARRRGRVELP